VLSSTPIVLLTLLSSAIFTPYLGTILDFYSHLEDSSKLDLELVEGIMKLKDLLAGSYTPFIFYGILILLLCLLVHTMNIYGVLTLNATSKKAALLQLLQASFYYFPKLLFATILKWSMIFSLSFMLYKIGTPTFLLILLMFFLWFILRLSNTYQIVDSPIIPSYFLSVKSVIKNPSLNLKLALLLLLEILIIVALYGVVAECLMFFGTGISLFLILLVTLLLVPSYLIWSFSNTIAFVLYYKEK
ncbi:MAG: hypothetical protein PHU71_06365, partial [Candidatus Gracilibacteria bacterium]|nr:hypothetical protein [Candidatus Gracilibacteria bacterium]